MPGTILLEPVQIQSSTGNILTITSTGEVNVTGTITSVPTGDVITSSAITTSTGYVTVHIDGYKSVAFVFTGTWTASLMVEASSDNSSTWNQTSFHASSGQMEQLLVGVPQVIQYVTTNGTYKSNTMGGITDIRIRPYSYTSGTINVIITKTEAQDRFIFTQSSIIQNVITSVNNSSTANLSDGGQFIGTADSTLGISTIQVSFICDQRCLIQVQQSQDGVHWDIEDIINVPLATARGQDIKAITSYIRVIVTNYGNQTTSYLRLQTRLLPVGDILPRALTDEGSLKVAVVEKNPHTKEGSVDKWHVQDIEARQLLEQILEELRTMNIYFEVMTDESVRNYDVIDSD